MISDRSKVIQKGIISQVFEYALFDAETDDLLRYYDSGRIFLSDGRLVTGETIENFDVVSIDESAWD